MNFTCDFCGGTFEETRDEADVQAEYEENFSAEERAGGPPAVACDDCYAKIMQVRA